MALWLLATQHCGLEAAGLFAAHDEAPEAAGCCAGSEGCASDGCATVEEGEYRSDQRMAAIPAPALLTVTLLLGHESTPALELRETPLVGELFERPRDWVTTWQFAQRAALSPRAPSLS